MPTFASPTRPSTVEGDHTQRTVWLRQLPLPIRLRVRTTVPHSLALFLRLLWTSSTLPWAPCWGNRVIQGSLGSQGRSHQPYPPPHTLVLTFVWTVDGRRAALLLATSICGEAICLPAAGPSEAGRRETTHGHSHAQQQNWQGIPFRLTRKYLKNGGRRPHQITRR